MTIKDRIFPLPPGGEGKIINVSCDQARITRLGEGLHQSRSFLPPAMERTLQALEEYDALCRKHQVKKVICVGTAAFRKAESGPEFMKEIQDKFGWETRMISGDEEARLSYLSVKRDFREKYSNLVALDIGGGSTEIISKESGISLELGTVVLTERHFKSDPPTDGEFNKVVETIGALLQPGAGPPPEDAAPLSRASLSNWGAPRGAPTLVALAGTATTLSSINQKLAIWDPSKIQGSMIKLSELEKMISYFRRTTHDALRTTPGMVPGREDTILAGSLILKAVMETLGVDFVVVSDRGLRYGLFYQEFSDARIL